MLTRTETRRMIRDSRRRFWKRLIWTLVIAVIFIWLWEWTGTPATLE